MLTNLVMMFVKLCVEHPDCIRRLHTETRDVLQCVQRKVEAAHFVQNNHVKRCCGRTLVNISVHMETPLIGASVHQGMNEPAIIMEGEDHRRTRGEERVE